MLEHVKVDYVLMCYHLIQLQNVLNIYQLVDLMEPNVLMKRMIVVSIQDSLLMLVNLLLLYLVDFVGFHLMYHYNALQEHVVIQ